MVKKKLIIAICLLLILAAFSSCIADPGTSSVDETSEEDASSQNESAVSDDESEFSESQVVSPDESEESDEQSDESEESEESGWRPYRNQSEVHIEKYKIPEIVETGFSFSNSSLTVGVGKSNTIQYEFKPLGVSKRELVWESSNPGIASVSENGVITGVSVGSTYIRATTACGNTASCKITVTEQASTPLGNLINSLTGGIFSDWTFAYYDVDYDGTEELIARKTSPSFSGPMVSIYRVSDGKLLTTLETGDGEGWGYWKSDDGERFILVSYKQTVDFTITRYAMEMIRPSQDGVVAEKLYYRDEYADGSVKCYVPNLLGDMDETSYEFYQDYRTSFFSKNKQSGKDFAFVSGSDSEAISYTLRKNK